LWIALIVSVLASLAGSLAGVSGPMRAHLGIWPAACAFILAIALRKERSAVVGKVELRLAFTAFVLVCVQATLGGLRVTQETAGFVPLATVLRIVHGCVAQAFLVVLVALAVRVSMLASAQGSSQPGGPSRLALWVGAAGFAVYGQLVLGAAMRHLGAGLAIPTFPVADPSGAWVPKTHNLFTDLNFTHTRAGALLVLALVLVAAFKVLRHAARPSRAAFWAGASVACVLVQVLLGVLVVLHQRPKTLATLHVLVGAVLISCLTATLVHLLSQSRSMSEAPSAL
jgi:cytochrome c oxidase assembly protein subunit 15